MGKKQKELAGFEKKSVAEIDDAAEAYSSEMQKRVKQSAKEKASKTALIELMKKNGLSVYKLDDGRIVTVGSKDNVRITSVDDDADDEQDAA